MIGRVWKHTGRRAGWIYGGDRTNGRKMFGDYGGKRVVERGGFMVYFEVNKGCILLCAANLHSFCRARCPHRAGGVHWCGGGGLLYSRMRYPARPVNGTMPSIVPYKLFATFTADGKVSLRRDGGIAPYKAWHRSLLIIKQSVGRGALTPPRRNLTGFCRDYI